jgi:hypothetical protein
MSTDYQDSHPLTPYLCFSDSYEDSESDSSGKSRRSTPQRQLLSQQPLDLSPETSSKLPDSPVIPRSIPSDMAPEPDTTVLQKVYERLPVGSAQKFTGGNTKAWLRNIQRDLAAAGVMDPSPALFFDIIDMMLAGNAATSLQKDTRISNLLEEPDSATADDIVYFKDTLQKQYFVAKSPETQISVDLTLQSLVQKASESNADYYARALEVFRDCTVVQGPAASASEKHFRMMAMKQYINGIHASELRYKAKEMGISKTVEVYEAYKVIQRAQALLDDLKKEKQDEALRSLMAQTTLHTSTHQNRPARSYQQPQPQLVPQPAPVTPAALPSVAPPAAPTNPVNPQQYQPPVQPQSQQPQLQQPPAPSAQPPQFPPRSSDWQRPLPDRSLSSHPFINGTAQYLRSAGLLCTYCGVLGHLTRNCTGEELSG